ncbi:serine hydrolase domain-containing protein [Microbulbifer sp. VAAC004]|uniref:serine hydrolase domain-containing protein n=1 Tax=unclassified Microbulbifer TaxID=2619833 RepID=UPI004039BDA4
MRVLYAVSLMIVGVFGFWAILPSQQERSAEITNIEEFLPTIMKEAAIPGMAVSRVKDGKLVFQQVYGMADVESGEAVTQNTPFNIASISKPIMGVTLLQLVDNGNLELNRDINTYLPFKVDNPHTRGEKITLRNLASHTAGIADYYDYATYSENRDPEISLEQHLRALLTKEGSLYNNGDHYLKSMPGKRRQYSNLSAGLAGLLVESAIGQTLADYSKDTLFHRLEMESASWKLNGMDLNSIAVPYKVEQCVPFVGLCTDDESSKINYFVGRFIKPPFEYKKFHPYPHNGNPQYPDGGVRVSIADLSDFLLAVLHNRDKSGAKLLSDTMYEEMFRLQLPKSVSDSQRFFLERSRWACGAYGVRSGGFYCYVF